MLGHCAASLSESLPHHWDVASDAHNLRVDLGSWFLEDSIYSQL